jgi:hypothetical protein
MSVSAFAFIQIKKREGELRMRGLTWIRGPYLTSKTSSRLCGRIVVHKN